MAAMGLRDRFQILGVLREVNLTEIKAGAERRFALYVVGDYALAGALADALGTAEGRDGRHPWLTVIPGGDVDALDRAVIDRDVDRLALVATPGAEPGAGEAAAVERLAAAGVPVVTVVMNDAAATWNGVDLARRGEAARALLPPAPSAADLRARLAPAVVSAAAASPHLGLALARQLPVLREPIVADLIEDVARANAVYAFSTGVAEIAPMLTIPLNLADLVFLTKNQLVLAYKIALASGKSGSVRDVLGEVLAVVGGGLFFRQIARELVGLIPAVGLVPKVAVAYAGTRVIGRVVAAWAMHGRRLGVGDLRLLYEEAAAGGRAMAEAMAARMRGRADGTS